MFKEIIYGTGKQRKRTTIKKVNKRSDLRFSKLTQNLRFSTRRNEQILQLMKGRTKDSQRDTKSNTYLLNLGPVVFSPYTHTHLFLKRLISEDK